jgi:hypothetical protein
MPAITDSKYYNRRVMANERRSTRESRFEPFVDAIPGIVFSIGGSIYADRAANFVWVHEWGARASQAQAYLPPHLNVWDGAGVMMQISPKPPYEYEIVKVHSSPYPRSVVESSNYARAQFGIHGVNHQYPTEATKGPDPVLIWAAAIQIFKAVATETDLTVTVGPLYYGNGASRAYFPQAPSDQVVDLTSDLPSAGNAVNVLIYLDRSTGQLATVSSAEVSAPGNPALPDTPANGIASAYFYLEDTYTTLSMADDYTDARRWISEADSTPSATAESQQLFADSSLNWVPGKIVTSGGDVVVSGGDVVWSPT